MKTRTKIFLKWIIWLTLAGIVLVSVLLPGATTDWRSFTHTLMGLVSLSLYIITGVLALICLIKYARIITSSANHLKSSSEASSTDSLAIPKYMIRRLKRYQAYLSIIFYAWVVLAFFLRDLGSLILFPPLLLVPCWLYYNARLRTLQLSA